jgi:large subunit ribosomal protein L23
MNSYDVIVRPVVTEKTVRPEMANKVAFRVKKEATKEDIRTAIESIFKVEVKAVHTLQMPSKPKRAGKKMGRRSGYKKAIVTLADGQSLDLLGAGLMGGDAAQMEETEQDA